MEPAGQKKAVEVRVLWQGALIEERQFHDPDQHSAPRELGGHRRGWQRAHIPDHEKSIERNRHRDRGDRRVHLYAEHRRNRVRFIPVQGKRRHCRFEYRHHQRDDSVATLQPRETLVLRG